MTTPTPPKFKKLNHHIFVCNNERTPDHPRGCCRAKGSEDLVAAFKAELSSKGLAGVVRAQKAGCLDVCEAGAAAVIYPEGVWYGQLTTADVSEIVQSHLVEGVPVERLRLASK